LQEVPIAPGLPYRVQSHKSGAIEYQGSGETDLHRLLKESGVRIFTIRHGETEANAAAPLYNSLLAGQVETPLTATGEAEARQAAAQLYDDLGGDKWLASADVSKLPVIYAGPLSRAQKTAQATVDYLTAQVDRLNQAGRIGDAQADEMNKALAIRTDPRLTEISFGAYEMHHGLDLAAHHPEFAVDYVAHTGKGIDFLHRFPKGEARMDVMARVDGFLRDVAQRDKGRTVLLFSHNETIDCAQAMMQSGAGTLRAHLTANASPELLVG
jgi:broad specificity phosphatase PhoE